VRVEPIVPLGLDAELGLILLAEMRHLADADGDAGNNRVDTFQAKRNLGRVDAQEGLLQFGCERCTVGREREFDGIALRPIDGVVGMRRQGASTRSNGEVGP